MIRLSNYLFCLSIHFILILALYFTYVHYIFYRGYSWGLSRAKFKKNKKKICGEETCHFDTVLTVLEAVG